MGLPPGATDALLGPAQGAETCGFHGPGGSPGLGGTSMEKTMEMGDGWWQNHEEPWKNMEKLKIHQHTSAMK